MTGERIAYIQAQWHTDITDHCREGFNAELTARGVDLAEVDLFTVPGSLEIPLMAKALATTGKYVAVCCSGFVVDGGIYRHDFVASAVLNGLVQVSIETGVPILSAVLTPHQFHEHETHTEFFARHMVSKGAELANACLEMRKSLQAVG